MVKLIDLGDAVVKIEDYVKKNITDLCIMVPSCDGSRYHAPAQSITIHGIGNLKTLQAALNDFFHNREDE